MVIYEQWMDDYWKCFAYLSKTLWLLGLSPLRAHQYICHEIPARMKRLAEQPRSNGLSYEVNK